MSEPERAPDAPAPMAEDAPAAPAPKRELSPALPGDASDVPSAKKVKQEAEDRRPSPAPAAAPATADEAAASPAADEPRSRPASKALSAAERAVERAALQAQRAAEKVQSKIHAQLAKGNEDRLRKASKTVAADAAVVAKHAAALEAAEAKARARWASARRTCTDGPGGVGVREEAARAPRRAKATPATNVTIKPVADILKEPGCPSNALPPHALEYVGDQGDRHKLMAWKKEVERIKDKIERDRDAYVARRRKELRAEAVKEGQAQTKVLAEVKKHAEARDKSSAALAKSSAALEQLRAKSAQLEEALKQKAVLASASDADPMVIKAKLELEKQLAKLEGRKLDDAKAMVERERAKEAAKAQREAQRKAEKAERDRVKEEEKAAKAAAREAALAAARKKKEDEILRKQREAKYPIDDEELAAEFAKESAEKGVDAATLGYKPLPTPTPVEDGPMVADEAALADFFSVFAEALKAPKGMGTTKGLLAVISACGNDLANAYKRVHGAHLRDPGHDPGHRPPRARHRQRRRNAAKWRRVMSDATWPEIVRRILERKKTGGAGAAALAERPWQELSVGEHVQALRGLADLALGGEKLRAIISKRLGGRRRAAHQAHPRV